MVENYKYLELQLYGMRERPVRPDDSVADQVTGGTNPDRESNQKLFFGDNKQWSLRYDSNKSAFILRDETADEDTMVINDGAAAVDFARQLGTQSNPIPGTTHFEAISTGELSIGTAGAKMSVDSTQIISSGSQTAVEFDAEDYDTDNYIDLSNNQFIAQQSGVHHIYAQVMWDDPTATGESRLIVSPSSGIDQTKIQQINSTGSFISFSINATFDLDQGDTVSINVEQSTGSDQEIYSRGGSRQFSSASISFVG